MTEPWWDDKPVAVIGSGPSLKGVDLFPIYGHCYALAVKGAIFDYPWADVGFGIDRPRFNEWAKALAKAPMPIVWGWDGGSPIDRVPNVTYLKRMHGDRHVLETDLSQVANGGTSGYSAVNFAFLKRAREIYLFGFDFRSTGKDWHANEAHYGAKRNMSEKSWERWAMAFKPMAQKLSQHGVTVWNASPDSAIAAFPKITIDEAIARLRHGARPS